MSTQMSAGLDTDQAPPLAIPGTFFLVAPVALVTAGVLMAIYGIEILRSSWTPEAVALAHLGTLGTLGAIMIGALYQMSPVVAAAPVPLVRIAHVVAALWAVGAGALVGGLLAAVGPLIWVGFVLLATAALLFVVPVGLALARTQNKEAPTQGMRLAVFAFALLVILGVRMAYGHATSSFPVDRALWLRAHVTLALLIWVGGLLVTVSLKIIPMFYLTPEFGRSTQRGLLIAIALSLVGASIAFFAGASGLVQALVALPAAIAVWLVHPLITVRLINRRRRKRTDPSLTFWLYGLAFAPLTFVAAGLAVWLDDPRWSVLFGWLALVGWASMIMHGMLTRIVPFLVWFHRLAALAGIVPVPPMRKLLPSVWILPGMYVHLAAASIGAVAIVTGDSGMTRLTGVLVALVGVAMATTLIKVLSYRPPEVPADLGISQGGTSWPGSSPG